MFKLFFEFTTDRLKVWVGVWSSGGLRALGLGLGFRV